MARPNDRAEALARSARGGGPSRVRPVFAALDLGTNNCRLLVARPDEGGFKVIDGFSQIVRLGEGVQASGRLSDAAMTRTRAALAACAARVFWRQPAAIGCVATQALRAAENAPGFLNQIRRDLGLDFRVITPEEEAKLAVLGCSALIDPHAPAALIVDIGGGSTELSWVAPKTLTDSLKRGETDPPLIAWSSRPVGVVALADAEPEPSDAAEKESWFERMVAFVVESLGAPEQAAPLRPLFAEGHAHIVGTSGAVTSLAGVHLGLSRYRRAEVDGQWISVEACRATAAKLRALSRSERANHPCIGPDRADLVLPGAAILEAVFRLWPSPRVRVADRGLREGVLMQLIAAHGARG